MTTRSAFLTTYSDRLYRHSTTVRHQGTVIAFAMTLEGQIYYSILDLNQPEAKMLDKDNWLKEPKRLKFPNEITQVGFGSFDLTMLPAVKKNGEMVRDRTSLRPDELDEFLSSTARFSMMAPFQVISEGNYLYVFRQAVSAGDPHNVQKQDAQGNLVTDQNGNPVSLVDSTLLLDRFVLAGAELQPKLDVRYQRSRSQRPQSRKDSLGSKDMEGKPFYEPTQELHFIRNHSLFGGRFAVSLLPTQIPDRKCWQIFAFNEATQAIDAWNLEQSDNGLFNTQGTLIDADGKLVPTLPAAKFALGFDGKTSYLELPSKLDSNSGTIELWVKFNSLDDQIIFDATTTTKDPANATNVVKYFFLDINQKKLRFWLEDASDADFQNASADLSRWQDNAWHHIAAVWNYGSDPARPLAATQLYLDGQLVGEDKKRSGQRPTVQTLFIGKVRNDSPLGQPTKSLAAFQGQLDEIRLWSVARSQSAIVAGRTVQLDGTEPGLAGYWRLDEGSGTTAYDQTNYAHHATLQGNVEWVKSQVQITENAGISKTSFRWEGRSPISGLSTLLYFQQETAAIGYDNATKPLKRSARLMLVTATRNPSNPTSEVVAIDFGVSRDGKLAQVPDVLSVQPISQNKSGQMTISQALEKVIELEPRARSLQAEVTRLQSALDLRNATIKLFDHENYFSPDGSYQKLWLKPPTTTAEGILSLAQARKIQSLSLDAGLKIRFTAEGCNNSLELTVSQPWFSPLNSLGEAPFYRYTLNYTRTLDANLVNLSVAELQTQLTALQNQLATVQADLERYRALAQGDVFLPMPLLYLDPSGLTTTGAVLDFAQTEETPQLFDSANGNLILYFRGIQDQFFAAYYDTLTERSTFKLNADEGTILFTARSAGAYMDDATIAITEDATDNGNRCTVTLESAALGIKEIWNHVSREVSPFIRTLNGTASPDPTDRFYYDYTQVTITGKPDSNLANGSLLFNLLNQDAPDQRPDFTLRDRRNVIRNTTLRLESNRTPSAQWYANPPGNALQFDGVDDYVSSDRDPAQFDVSGDLTLEAWVKPLPQGDAITRIIEQKSAQSRYTLGLQRVGAPSAIALDFGDSIVLSAAFNLASLAYTIEFWAQQANNAPSDGLLWVRQEAGHAAPQALIVLNADRLTAFPAWTGIQAPIGSSDTDWHHWAIVCDPQTYERVIYRDGQRVQTDQPQFPVVRNAELYLGSTNTSGGFKGTIDEIRVWNVARSQRQINEAMNQFLSGNQAGQLIGCWRFGQNGLKDYSGNQHITNQLSHRQPKAVDSAIAYYNPFTGVGTQVFTTTKRIAANDWSHLAAVCTQAHALKFNGTQDFLSCGNSPTLDISRDLTIEVFLRIDSLGQRRGILSKGSLDDGTGQDVPYALSVDQAGKLVFMFEDTDHGNHEFTSTQALAPGQQYRVAVTRKYMTDAQKEPPQQWYDMRFYISSRVANAATYTVQKAGDAKYQLSDASKDIGSSNQPLEIGKASIEGGDAIFFHGTISEVRIWNDVRDAGNVCSDIQGREKGLISWWRFEENAGTIAYDSKSTNHATRTGATWVPDPHNSKIVLYCNGEAVPLVATSVAEGRSQFTLGALQTDQAIQDAFSGQMEEVRIWQVARAQEQIQDNLFRRLLGEQEDLIANYTFDAEVNGELRDHSFLSHHLKLGTGTHQPLYVYSTAPISDETPQARNVLSSVKTPFQDVVHSPISVQEYGDLQLDAGGNLNGILKRCYCFIQNGAWQLITGFKVGNLVAEWISQVQTAPQLIGFIEGAPPVPSENLTDTSKDYRGATAVTLTEASSTMYSYAASRDRGFDTSVQASAAVGLAVDATTGLGFAKTIVDVESFVGIKTSFENSLGWLDTASVGTGTQTAKTSSLTLQGTWETQPLYSAIGKRFVPRNVGFALVQSETADVFALRLKHNNALVAYQMRPNPDIPKDWNILTFPINPRYIKQGTLDGKVGFETDRNYPNATNLTTDASYFKPIEAYALKNRIVREEERLKAYFEQYEAGKIGRREASAQFSKGDLGTGAIADKLPRFEKRNMVNTYVWTAEGGLFAESEQTMDIRQEVTGGAYAFVGKVGAYVDAKAVIMDVAVAFELEAMFGGHLNLSVTKTQDSTTSFGLAINLNGVEQDIYRRDNGQLVLDNDPLNPEPKKQEGKVDAYRFMTFYLQPNVSHFDEFVQRVVDDRWLAQSSDPNAIALRNAVQSQAAKKEQDKSVPWRVLHRVTYCSRVLPNFQTPAVTPLEKALIDLDIASNWELIKTLEPFVKNKISVDFNDAVSSAIATYLPELKPHTAAIIQYMRQYFQVTEAA